MAHTSWRDWLRGKPSFKSLLWGATILATACSDGGTGCSDAVPYPVPPYPGGEIQNGVVRARVTQHGLDFLSRQLGTVLESTVSQSLLPIHDGRATYYVDEAVFPADSPIRVRDGCLGDNAANCQQQTAISSIAFDVKALRDSLVLTWLPPNAEGLPGIRATLADLRALVDMVLEIKADGILPPAACHFRGRDGAPALTIASIGFDARLEVTERSGEPTLDGYLDNIVFDLADDGHSPIADLVVTACDGGAADPDCSDAVCDRPSADCEGVCSLGDLLVDAGGFLTAAVEPLLQALAPQIAETLGGTLFKASANLPLAFAATVDLADIVGGPLADISPLYARGAAGDLTVSGPERERGLDIALDAGVTMAPSRCMVQQPLPDLSQLLGSGPSFSGFVEVEDPGGGTHIERYHVAAAVSSALLEQLTWAIFQGGVTCLILPSQDIEQIAGGALSLTAGLLMDLDARLAGIAAADAPLLLTLHAGTQPHVRLGAAREIADGVYEPLIELRVDDLTLGLFIFIDDAQRQLSGVRTDLALQLGIERTSPQRLAVVVQTLSVHNSRQIYNELAPGADLASLLQSVVDLGLEGLVGDALRVEFDVANLVRDALAIPVELRLNAVRRDLDDGGRPYLSAYASLCDAVALADPDDPICYVDATTSIARSLPLSPPTRR